MRLILVAALLVRLALAFLIHGSHDVRGWTIIAESLAGGENPYETGFVNWPPPWALIVTGIWMIAKTTALPFPFLVKLVPIAADLAIVAALRRHVSDRAAILYAFNPLAIFTASVQAQFDALPLLCTLMAIVYAEKRAATWLAAGALFKTWPLFVLPAIVARAKHRVLTGTIAVLPWALVIAALYGINPAAVGRYVLGYGGLPGWWGFTSLPMLFGDTKTFGEDPLRLFFYAVMAAVAALVILRRMEAPRAALLLLLTFYVFAPGFGLYYLLWVVPLGLIADPRRTNIYTAIATVVIVIETLFRPFDGSLGWFVRASPPPEYFRAYLGNHDRFWTVLLRLPVWGYCVYWWMRAHPRGWARIGIQ